MLQAILHVNVTPTCSQCAPLRLCLNAFDAKFGTALHRFDQFQSFVVVHGIRYLYESLEDKDLSVFNIFLFNLLVF